MNWTIDFAGIAALLLALVTLAKAFTTSKTDKQKMKMDLTRQLQELANSTAVKNVDLMKQMMGLQDEISVLRQDIKVLIRLNLDWCEGIAALTQQLSDAGLKPAWNLDRNDLEDLVSKYGY